MNILIIEPYFGGSHKYWAESIQKFSRHRIQIIPMKDSFWKWRMHGAAITCTKLIKKYERPDLILTTSMIDLATFKGLLPITHTNIPIVLYMHENQFSYPWPDRDKEKNKGRDEHYHFIQLLSALACEKIIFNSIYNKETFLSGCKNLLKKMPDYQELDSINNINKKSTILPIGISISKFNKSLIKDNKTTPTIIWNHRWEEDKNPVEFFTILRKLKERDFKFKLIVIGHQGKSSHYSFSKARDEFNKEITHWGEVKTIDQYLTHLCNSDISIITSKHDFFGISSLEAVCAGCTVFFPDRLAYPEHFPLSNRSEIFYHNQDELLNKVLNWKNIDMNPFQKELNRYNWKHVIKDYDSIFENIRRATLIKK